MHYKACSLDPSYGPNFSFSSPNFSKRFEYMILQELPPSIRTLEMLNSKMEAIITKVKIFFDTPHTFSPSRNLRIGLSIFPVEVPLLYLPSPRQCFSPSSLYMAFLSHKSSGNGRNVLPLPFKVFLFIVVVIPFLSFNRSFHNLLGDVSP